MNTLADVARVVERAQDITRAIPVTRGEDVIFIPLPRALWRPNDGCCCRYCSPERGSSRPSFWDTLAVSARREPGKSDHTWAVHYPELHGLKPLRDEPRENRGPWNVDMETLP
jgi:hypothetical protein